MNIPLLKIFLQDPQPWGHSTNEHPKSILAPFSALNCTETWMRSEEYPCYMPANGGVEKSYALHPQSDRIYKIECFGEDGMPEIKGTDVWVYSTLCLSVRCQKSIPERLVYPAVRGSLRFQGDDEMMGALCQDDVFNPRDQTVTFQKDGWLIYSPLLSMRLKTLHGATGPHQSQWTLELIEKMKKDV